MRPAANHVYVISPNKYLVLRGGVLRPEPVPTGHGIRMAIDHFFRSLASDQGKRAVGIVVSGTATDGTQGLKAVKEAGGLTLVQSPESAQSDGMPRSALATRLVDHALAVE